MLHNVISELVDEKGLKKSDLNEIIKEGILAAYLKKYPEAILRIDFDRAGTVNVEIEKIIVSEPEDELTQISIRKARFIKKGAQLDETLWMPFDGTIGRVEILKAKQVIASRIRDVEAINVYNEFIDKQGTIIHGTVHKCENSGTTIMLRDTMAFLPRSLSIPGERLVAGRPVKALLKDVFSDYRTGGQLILDRSSGDFLIKLLELEIPEIYDKLIEIKGVARKAGYKSKIIVASHDVNIDPVGTCVGVGGGRIKPILKELCNEKIDVISWVNSKEELVKNALRPAEVNKVEIVDKEATVWLSEDQRAFAIGKMGQNISLAAELLDVNIHLMSSGGSSKEESATFGNADAGIDYDVENNDNN
ncbi:transcription termination factor NusA [Candidatus Babeliales bacterium]|nr:transcription termination factor NusA [Candidatus Babeliales bacterium]MBP9843478.1 transcription termination factor NusA [Candidatus Babeliales bacterium]